MELNRLWGTRHWRDWEELVVYMMEEKELVKLVDAPQDTEYSRAEPSRERPQDIKSMSQDADHARAPQDALFVAIYEEAFIAEQIVFHKPRICAIHGSPDDTTIIVCPNQHHMCGECLEVFHDHICDIETLKRNKGKLPCSMRNLPRIAFSP